MALEIERKFLVKNDAWRGAVECEWRILQGYLATSGDLTVRVRLRGDDAFLTIKGPPRGPVRSEFEYAIPPEDGEAMLRELAILPLIDKTRYRVPCGAHYWDLDVFAGDNAGLVLAEIELKREHEPFEHPAWAGLEVTGDLRYSNANLARRPFKEW
ncbi:CYTH domain-containing protein [uncultured Thiodictyon sp.]|uniref:CYTH domain-containing protein n=1 Tax=uncultured Thiodictyon sp. TaxID=1846217 RepID=UPI0025CD5829|nr:CYTH domain-containing protein [uncultured Thiodictyon sp.]